MYLLSTLDQFLLLLSRRFKRKSRDIIDFDAPYDIYLYSALKYRFPLTMKGDNPPQSSGAIHYFNLTVCIFRSIISYTVMLIEMPHFQ